MAWEDVKLEYEIDINNPLKSIKEICNEVYNKIAKKEKRSIELITVSLESSNGAIEVDFSLDKLLKRCEILYVGNIGTDEIYKIVKKHMTYPPNSSYIGPCLRVEDAKTVYTYYKIMKAKDKLLIEATPSIKSHKKLYNSLREALERFRISEAYIKKVIKVIPAYKYAEINILADKYDIINDINTYIDIFMENVKKGFSATLSNTWIETPYIHISYNQNQSKYIEIVVEPPTEEKMKQLLTDMKNIGMDTKIRKATAL